MWLEPSKHARKASAAETWRARWVVGEDGAEEVARGSVGRALKASEEFSPILGG